MKLTQLLAALDSHDLHGDGEVEIKALTCDPRGVVPGSGSSCPARGRHGRPRLHRRPEAGAAGVVLEDERHAPAAIPWVKVRTDAAPWPGWRLNSTVTPRRVCR